MTRLSKKVSCGTLNNNLPSGSRDWFGLFLLVNHIITVFSSSLIGTKDEFFAPFQIALLVLPYTQTSSAIGQNLLVIHNTS